MNFPPLLNGGAFSPAIAQKINTINMQTTNPIGMFLMVDAGISAGAETFPSPLVAFDGASVLSPFLSVVLVDSTEEELSEEELSDESNDSDMNV